MKKFNVNTPEEWKTSLFEQIACDKKTKIVSFRPLITAAAAFAVIAATIPAFASSDSFPEWISRWFLGDSKLTNTLYSEKNVIFDDNSDEIDVICSGIMGDKHNVAIHLEIKATGENEFSKNDADLFVFNSQSFVMPDGSEANVVSSVDLSQTDAKTLSADYFITVGNETVIPESVNIALRDLVLIDENGERETIVSGNFSAEIALDYNDSGEVLNKAEHSALSAVSYSIDESGFVAATNEMTEYIPEKLEISNVSVYMVFEACNSNIPDFHLKSGDIKEEHIPIKSLTVVFSDGTEAEYSAIPANSTNKHILTNNISCSNSKLTFSGILEDAIDASEVKTVKINGNEFFVK